MPESNDSNNISRGDQDPFEEEKSGDETSDYIPKTEEEVLEQIEGVTAGFLKRQ